MIHGEHKKAAKTEHTPEPWIAEGSFIGIPNGKGTFYMCPLSGINQERRESDARRIVACVNACAGLPTESLERVSNETTAVFDLLMQTTKQRDELLAALTYVIEDLELRASLKEDEDERGVVDIGDGAYNQARAAIASVKGGAA